MAVFTFSPDVSDDIYTSMVRCVNKDILFHSVVFSGIILKDGGRYLGVAYCEKRSPISSSREAFVKQSEVGREMNLKLETVIIPVSDVDCAKEFYEKALGWRVDIDHRAAVHLSGDAPGHIRPRGDAG